MTKPIGPDDVIPRVEQRFLEKVNEIVELINTQLIPQMEQGYGRTSPIRVNLTMDLRDAVVLNPALATEFMAQFKSRGWSVQRLSEYQFDFIKSSSDNA